jgi:hypothetical protein
MLIVMLVVALWMQDGYAQPMEDGEGRRFSAVSERNPYSSSEVHLTASCDVTVKTICGWSSITQAACVSRGIFLDHFIVFRF